MQPTAGRAKSIQVGDRLLELRFTLGVLRELEKTHAISVYKGEGLRDVIYDPDKLAIVLFHGLKTKQPDITQTWVDDNIDGSMLFDLMPILTESIMGRTPDEIQKLANRPNGIASEVPLTGLPPGLSDATISTSPKPNSGS